MTNLWGVFLTVFAYLLALYLHRYKGLNKIPCVLLTSGIIITVLGIARLEYSAYNTSAAWVTFLLGPATISLAYPLSQNVKLLTQNKIAVYSGILFSAVSTLGLTFILGNLMGVDWAIITSIMPKAVTTPIAVEISKSIGGISELTVFIVMLSGLFGAVFGHTLLKLLKVRSDISIGLSIGSTSHVLGTATCIEKNRSRQVAISTLSLIVTGILTAFLAPLFIRIVH